MKFKQPGQGFCPQIEVPEGKYWISSRSARLLEEHALFFRKKDVFLKDTGETDEYKARDVALKMIDQAGEVKWHWDSCAWVAEDGALRYYLIQGRKWPRNWFLRCCYDEEIVMVQGQESYADFVLECEEYVNEEHGQCSLWGV